MMHAELACRRRKARFEPADPEIPVTRKARLDGAGAAEIRQAMSIHRGTQVALFNVRLRDCRSLFVSLASGTPFMPAPGSFKLTGAALAATVAATVGRGPLDHAALDETPSAGATIHLKHQTGEVSPRVPPTVLGMDHAALEARIRADGAIRLALMDV